MPRTTASRPALYRGSSRHKNRPADEQKGTLCPEWTHATSAGGFATDVHAHDWAATRAAKLFAAAWADPVGACRYATAEGIAFAARPSGDGSWHGYPIPWESVPPQIKDAWLAQGAVTRRQLKAFLRFDKGDIHWALRTDTR